MIKYINKLRTVRSCLKYRDFLLYIPWMINDKGFPILLQIKVINMPCTVIDVTEFTS